MERSRACGYNGPSPAAGGSCHPSRPALRISTSTISGHGPRDEPTDAIREPPRHPLRLAARWPNSGRRSGSTRPGDGSGSPWPRPSATSGSPIEQAQIDELRSKVDDIDFDAARRHETRLRHDVMAHVHALGDVAPTARHDHPPRRDELLRHRQHRPDPDPRGPADCPRRARRRHRRPRHLRRPLEGPADCLGYTHFQPAQLVTVGKRATLWCYELILDLQRGRAADRRAEVPRREGDDRHPGELPRPLRRRSRQGRGPRPAGRRGVRLRGDRPRLGADVHAQGRFPGRRDARRASASRPTGSGRTCDCSRTSGRSRSRSRPSRSARRRWPTSGTRCGPSGCARSPGS